MDAAATTSAIFRFKREKDETWADYYARTCSKARNIWLQMGVPSLYEVIAKIIWRAMGWVCDERPTAVIDTTKNVFRWESTKWWQPTQASGTKEDPCNHTKW